MRDRMFLLVILFFFSAANSQSAELIMLEEAGCVWCERWNEEVGVIYHKTDEGKRAPLRRIDVHENLPDDLKSMQLSPFTPTFVLWDNGQEVSRLRGYPGEDFFWPLLREMLDKVK